MSASRLSGAALLAKQMRSTPAHVRTPLPGLPHLLRLLSDDDVEFEELLVAIEQYPNIAARLLAVANSAWSAPLAPVTTLVAACTHLGLRLIRSITISVAVSTPFNALRCPGFDAIRFWFSALVTADCADRLVRICPRDDSVNGPALYTAGLLHNLGLLWLCDRCPTETSAAFEMAENHESMAVNDAVRHVLGADIREVSAALLDSWRIPEPVIRPIASLRDFDPSISDWRAAAMLRYAADTASSLWRDEGAVLDSPIPAMLALAPDKRAQLERQMADKAKSLRKVAGTIGRF